MPVLRTLTVLLPKGGGQGHQKVENGGWVELTPEGAVALCKGDPWIKSCLTLAECGPWGTAEVSVI